MVLFLGLITHRDMFSNRYFYSRCDPLCFMFMYTGPLREVVGPYMLVIERAPDIRRTLEIFVMLDLKISKTKNINGFGIPRENNEAQFVSVCVRY